MLTKNELIRKLNQFSSSDYLRTIDEFQLKAEIKSFSIEALKFFDKSISPTNSNKAQYFTMTYISKKYFISLGDIKNILLQKQICSIKNRKIVPNNEYVKNGLTKAFSHNSGNTYYKYHIDLINKYFRKK